MISRRTILKFISAIPFVGVIARKEESHPSWQFQDYSLEIHSHGSFCDHLYIAVNEDDVPLFVSRGWIVEGRFDDKKPVLKYAMKRKRINQS